MEYIDGIFNNYITTKGQEGVFQSSTYPRGLRAIL